MLALIVLRGIYIARKCRDGFGALLAIGISSMVGIQAFINLGSISGILPITGVTLPFVSYGGSSLLILMISMGVLNNIAMTVKQNDEHPVKEKHPQQEKQFYQVRGGKEMEQLNHIKKSACSKPWGNCDSYIPSLYRARITNGSNLFTRRFRILSPI
ncbi:FtsW/RodA/SpoVE family cell cycle protein [Virgibacillus halophilus]|uniref:Probable peptidoglycan glycosyltransferase FtsW n=1 Tax=Tigheibacillus halophilus TaxID=361280 RepID=A0ABU5CA98_9BACI|nr:FtsW/RodA/SpoVE family cell cycle protein [Virgibacillus halophilus]